MQMYRACLDKLYGTKSFPYGIINYAKISFARQQNILRILEHTPVIHNKSACIKRFFCWTAQSNDKLQFWSFMFS